MLTVDIKRLIDKLNGACRSSLEDAAGICAEYGQHEISVEHFVLGLLKDPRAEIVLTLRHIGLNPDQLREALSVDVGRMSSDSGTQMEFSQLLFDLIQDAWLVASVDLDKVLIGSGAVLLALVQRARFFAFGEWPELLRPYGRGQLVSALLEAQIESSEYEPPRAPGRSTLVEKIPSGAAIERYCINFSERAKDGAIDPVFGREQEIRQMIEILCRRRKNNPIIVGEPGVGKTAIVEGLALKIAAGDVPLPLRDAVLLGLDVGALEAGAGVRGEFESRLRQVILEIKSMPCPAVLFIDEAHVIVRSPSAGGNDFANLLKPALANGELRAVAATTWSEYKKYFEKDSALARRFQVVSVPEPGVDGAKLILRGLRDRYESSHGVFISEEGIDAAVDMADRYIHGRQLPDKALDLLDTACAQVSIGLSSMPEEIELAERDIGALELRLDGARRAARRGGEVEPSVALSAMNETLARKRADRDELVSRWKREETLVLRVNELRAALVTVAPQDVETARTALLAAEHLLQDVQGNAPMLYSEVGADVVAKVVSRWTGIPLGKVLREQSHTILSLSDGLKCRVRGQNHALERIAETIRTGAAGLKDPRQPLGVLLLVGPSGTGKTETALALADQLFGDERAAIIFNMSEFRESHTVSRLIGSPPGYVGYGEGGLLTEAVRQRPYSVILLDEVEKAHLDVMNLFYQVFDKGMLSDGEGKLIDFSQTVILMTSNLASDTIAEGSTLARANGDASELAHLIRPALNSHFKPALLARMTVIPYLTLSPEVLREVIVLKLESLAERVKTNHRLVLRYSDDVVESVARRCLAAEAGARNADAILRIEIAAPLSEQILQHLLSNTQLPDEIWFDVNDVGKLVCRFTG